MKLCLNAFSLIVFFTSTVFSNTQKVDDFDKQETKLCTNNELNITSPLIKSEINDILFGKVSDGALFVNFNLFKKFEVDVTLDNKNNAIDMTDKDFISQPEFKISGTGEIKNIRGWILTIFDNNITPIHKIAKKGPPPNKIVWEQKKSNPKMIPDKSYFFTLNLIIGRNIAYTTEPKAFITRKVTTIKTKIKSENLASYQKILSTQKTKKFLQNLTKTVAANPEETIHLIGYSTPQKPTFCDNMFRLRNYMVSKANLPIDRFIIACSRTKESNRDSKYIAIVGARPEKKITRIDFKEHSKPILTIDRKETPFDKNGFFMFPKAAPNHNYILKLVFTNGETIATRINRKEHSLALNSGMNNIKGYQVKTVKDFTTTFACSLKDQKPLSFKAIYGFGGYAVNNSLTPSLNNLTVFNLQLSRNSINLLGFKNLTAAIDITAIPGSFTALKEKDQSIYNANAFFGYELRFSTLNFTPFLGYYVYTAKDVAREDNTSFVKLSYGGHAGFSLYFKNPLFNRITTNYSIKIIPYMLLEISNFGILNDLTFFYNLNRKYGLTFTIKKNIFKYLDNETDNTITESLNAIILGFSHSF